MSEPVMETESRKPFNDELGQLCNDLKTLASNLAETIRSIDRLSGDDRLGFSFAIPTSLVHPQLIGSMDNAKAFLAKSLEEAKTQLQYDEMRWAQWLAAERTWQWGMQPHKDLIGFGGKIHKTLFGIPVVDHNGDG